METAVLVGIGMLAVGIIVCQLMGTARGSDCVSCKQVCGNYCNRLNK